MKSSSERAKGCPQSPSAHPSLFIKKLVAFRNPVREGRLSERFRFGLRPMEMWLKPSKNWKRRRLLSRGFDGHSKPPTVCPRVRPENRCRSPNRSPIPGHGQPRTEASDGKVCPCSRAWHCHGGARVRTDCGPRASADHIDDHDWLPAPTDHIDDYDRPPAIDDPRAKAGRQELGFDGRSLPGAVAQTVSPIPGQRSAAFAPDGRLDVCPSTFRDP
jgi:hypothetical protein